MWRHFAPASDFAGAALVAFYAGGCMRSGGGSGFVCGGGVGGYFAGLFWWCWRIGRWAIVLWDLDTFLIFLKSLKSLGNW